MDELAKIATNIANAAASATGPATNTPPAVSANPVNAAVKNTNYSAINNQTPLASAESTASSKAVPPPPVST